MLSDLAHFGPSPPTRARVPSLSSLAKGKRPVKCIFKPARGRGNMVGDSSCSPAAGLDMPGRSELHGPGEEAEAPVAIGFPWRRTPSRKALGHGPPQLRSPVGSPTARRRRWRSSPDRDRPPRVRRQRRSPRGVLSAQWRWARRAHARPSSGRRGRAAGTARTPTVPDHPLPDGIEPPRTTRLSSPHPGLSSVPLGSPASDPAATPGCGSPGGY